MSGADSPAAALGHSFTNPHLAVQRTTVKRFEPSHWTVDFPRGSMAAVVSEPGLQAIDVEVVFARQGDLVGLIYESEDRLVHVGHRREHKVDYRHCQLSFRWQASGIAGLDAVNGPTLTIEGKDENGAARTWYVRLWNYAVGTPHDARIAIDFDALDGGFMLPGEAQRVYPGAIDRMFVSLVPPTFSPGSDLAFAEPLNGRIRLSDIECEGSGSVLSMNDAFVPEHGLRMCTAYDDSYPLTPERMLDSIERLGYRKVINHYVGMSHYPALGQDGLVNASADLCAPARKWHESFARLAAARGYDVIWSLSFELLEMFCPEPWKQRRHDGTPARTGYTPPSTLVSPASAPGVAYLCRIAKAFVAIGVAAGLPPLFQVGEPWWWVDAANAPYFYDDAARASLPATSLIVDVRAADDDAAKLTLDQAGAILSGATAALSHAVKGSFPDTKTHILPYLPAIVREDAPELVRANLPIGWRFPAFERLQLEDYEWTSEDRAIASLRGLHLARERLSYPLDRQHFLAGFVANSGDRHQWRAILGAAARERRGGVAETFIWAFPQVMRDNLTIFEKGDDVESFRDEDFPLDIGCAAWVEPRFSTTIATGSTGTEWRNVNWSQSRSEFDVGPGLRSADDIRRLTSFFRSVRGSAVAFRFRDPIDHSTANDDGEPGAEDVLLGVGDNVKRHFPLLKNYGDGELRRITRPVPQSIKVSINSVPIDDWTLRDGGLLELGQPLPVGAELRAGFLFDVPVRFRDDAIRVAPHGSDAADVPSVRLIEVREA